MSICLSQLAAATSQVNAESLPVLPRWMVTLLAVGACVLAVWVAWRVMRPSGMSLKNTPGRTNHLGFPLLAGLWLAPQGVMLVLVGPAPLPPTIAFAGITITVTAIAQAVGAAVCLAAAAWAFPTGLRRGLGLSMRHWPWDLLRGTLGYLAVLPVCMALLLLTVLILPKGLQAEHPMLVVIADPGTATWIKVVTALSAVVLAPLAEEVLYRGLIQSYLRSVTASPWVAVGITSVIFVAPHSFEPQALPALLVLSGVLGYTYERTGRLTVPILIHALFNGVFVLWALTGPTP